MLPISSIYLFWQAAGVWNLPGIPSEQLPVAPRTWGLEKRNEAEVPQAEVYEDIQEK